MSFGSQNQLHPDKLFGTDLVSSAIQLNKNGELRCSTTATLLADPVSSFDVNLLALSAATPINMSSMSASDSYIIHDHSPSEDNDDVDSLPSVSSGDLTSEADSDAQREWEASLEQIQLLLTMVLVPFVGKYFGRKFAYWSTLVNLPAPFPATNSRRLTRCVTGWARYMEWNHNVEIRWTNRKEFAAVGAVEAAATL